MSKWESLQLEERIAGILRGVRYHRPHHFGRPYLTTYQLAIAVDTQYPEVRQQLRYPLGGKGAGRHSSLAQYLARELSRRIRLGIITTIEGAFVSKDAGIEITCYLSSGEAVESSLTDVYDLSMFRLRD